MNPSPTFSLLAPRLPIFGCPVYDLTWDGALSFVNELASLPMGQTHITFLNANNANIMLSDRSFRDVLGRSVVLPDGVGLDIASHMLNGEKFVANLNGTDFVPALLTYMVTPRRIGLIGGSPEVLEAATAGFQRHAPWHRFVPISDGFFDKENSSEVLAALDAEKLDILLVGMGTPLQEKWVDRNIQTRHARVVMSVGALFDFASGRVPRAPSVLRSLRVEWAYRLWLEPERLWRRYILGIPVFLYNVLRYKLSERNAAGGKSTRPQHPARGGKA